VCASLAQTLLSELAVLRLLCPGRGELGQLAVLELVLSRELLGSDL